MRAGTPITRLVLGAFLFASVVVSSSAQQPQSKISKYERDEVLQMLDAVSSDVKKHYYDPKIHGVDWDASVKNFRQRIEETPSLNSGMSEVAAALDTLEDSHTFFVPPPRPYKHNYGWRIAMIGDNCFVLGVRPQSDAEKKGVKAGDQVLAINGFEPTGQNLWKMKFVFEVLRPQPALSATLRSPNGERKDVEIVAAFRQTQQVKDVTGEHIWDLLREFENEAYADRMRWTEVDQVMILKFPVFFFSESEVDNIMKKARKHSALIVDLRGNGGGSVETLRAFLSNFFDHEVKIADRVTRDNSKPVMARSGGKNAFAGKLIVLVDSRSGSASEILARVIQLEKRGTVLGDRSAGAVMESRRYQHQIGSDRVVFYGVSITDANLIMTDGNSLEHVGVLPDELLLPSPDDLASGRDPVLARAVEIAGGKLPADVAGKLLPYEWPKE